MIVGAVAFDNVDRWRRARPILGWHVGTGFGRPDGACVWRPRRSPVTRQPSPDADRREAAQRVSDLFFPATPPASAKAVRPMPVD